MNTRITIFIKAPNGKASAMFYKEEYGIQTGWRTVKRRLDTHGGKLFNPKGDWPMRGWVQLSYNDVDKWPEITKTSYEQVKWLKR